MHLFFSTPVWNTRLKNFENINKGILNYILELQKTDPKGTNKSNFTGWHSKDFNLNDKSPKIFIGSLMEAINSTLNDMDWDLEKQDVKME